MKASTCFLAVLALAAGAAGAQDLGTSSAKGKIAREAGIGSYQLIDNSGDVLVRAWAANGEDLAECVARFGARTATADCDLPSGERYRWTLDKAAEHVAFEDLRSGESVKIRFEFTTPQPEGLVYTGPDGDQGHAESEILVEGDKTLEEFDRDWGEASRMIGLLVGEVMHTLDINISASSPGATSPPQGIDGYCDLTTSRWVCRTDFGVQGRASLTREEICCEQASLRADITCLLLTDRRCCANGRTCNMTCRGGVCNCDLIGYPWECVLCD